MSEFWQVEEEYALVVLTGPAVNSMDLETEWTLPAGPQFVWNNEGIYPVVWYSYVVYPSAVGLRGEDESDRQD